MRKILAGVLGVAGLLAVVLAVSAGPATAQQQKVVTFTSGQDAGTYTVSWSTSGGCDPAKPGGDVTLATDGATGSKTMVVRNPADVADDAAIPTAAPTGATTSQLSVSVGTHCNYTFEYAFTSSLPGSDGVNCKAGVVDGTPDLDAASPAAIVSVERDASPVCDATGTITVTVSSGVDHDTHEGAVLSTTFTVTATPVKDSHKECMAVTEATEVNENTDATDDDTVEAELTVLHTTLDDQATCRYDVSVDLPDGFTASSKDSNIKKNVEWIAVTTDPAEAADSDGGSSAALDATDCGLQRFVDGATGEGSATDADNDDAVTVSCRLRHADPIAEVQIAERKVYILQSVEGDSDGGNGRYTLTEDGACGIPADLPDDLLGTGGIDTTPGVTIVELREGYFNISPAVMRGTFQDGAPRLALNEEADTCVVTAAVSHLPDHCSAAVASQSVNLVSGVDSKDRGIVRFDITCAAPAPADDDGGEDMTGSMDGGEDMTGSMDDDTGTMNGGSMENMGPPEDTPTG